MTAEETLDGIVQLLEEYPHLLMVAIKVSDNVMIRKVNLKGLKFHEFKNAIETMSMDAIDQNEENYSR